VGVFRLSSRRGAKLTILLVSLPILVISALPIIFLILGSVTKAGQFGTYAFTLSNLSRVFSDPDLPKVLANTLIFGAGGALIATGMATVYSWIIIRLTIPGKRVLEMLVVLAITIPMVVKGFGWMFLLSPKIGIINITFMRLFGTDTPLFNIYSLPGLIVALGAGGLPICYLNISASMNSMDPSLEESARITGAGILSTWRRVTLQVLRPAIFSAFMLIFILGVENFDYPYVLGTPGRIETLSTKIYDLVLQSQPPQWELACAYGLIYLGLTIGLVTIYIWSTRKAFKFVTVTGKASQRTLMRVGRKGKFAGLLTCVLILLFSFGLPLIMIFIVSILPYYTVVGKTLLISGFTLNNYQLAFSNPLFLTALTNSITIAAIAGGVGTLLATFISYATLKMRVRWTRVLEYLSTLPLAFPGVVFGLGLLWSFLTVPFFSKTIYGTNWALILGLLIMWIPASTRIVSGNLIQISNELEEAAYVSGASWWRTFTRILIPLLKIGLVNSFMYIFLNSFRELGAVVLLVTSQSYVMTSLITDLFKTSAAMLPIASAFSVLMTLMLAAFVVAMRLIFKASITQH
jgi:iron(III) transport system permease protein